jgi:sucrose-6-phosphate hydrolase SacC (GH32 family)
VLTPASSEYMVGGFDGAKFTPETPKLPGHRGKGYYAPQTFSDIPQSDGRRIQIGWFQTPTSRYALQPIHDNPAGASLVGTSQGPRFTWTPVKELAAPGQKHTPPLVTLSPQL